MKAREIFEDGRIVKGVNTTADVGVNQTKIEAAKFGNTVTKDGVPPTLSKQVKGKSTNVAFNLGLSESNKQRNLTDFIKFCKEQLTLTTSPSIKFVNDTEDTTFGYFDNDNKNIVVQLKGRHQMDVMRTVAHELVHYKQDKTLGRELDGRNGSVDENEANSLAGELLRRWGQKNPTLFTEAVAVEPHAKGYQKDKLTMPQNTLVIDTPGDLDWYKLGHDIANLDQADPHEYGQGDSDVTITSANPEEMRKLMKQLDRLGLKYKSIGGTSKQPEIHSESNPFTDARMNAIKADKDTFKVGSRTYKVTGDTSDEKAADEKSLDERQRLDPKCWKGYRKDGTKTKDGVRVNNCVKVGEGEYTWEGDLEMLYDDEEALDEAEYQGRKVQLGKPMQGDVKKFKVYVKNPKGNIVKVNFGDPNMRIKKSNPARRRSFRARHNCDNPGPRHKARYWSCRKW